MMHHGRKSKGKKPMQKKSKKLFRELKKRGKSVGAPSKMHQKAMKPRRSMKSKKGMISDADLYSTWRM